MAQPESLENVDFSARDELAMLAKELAENPSTRADMLRLTRKVRPDLPIPELEIEDKLAKHHDAQAKELEAMRVERARDKAEQQLKEKRAKLKAERGLGDEDVERIEKVMMEKRIPDHDTAADYDEWMRQAAQPTPTGYKGSPVGHFNLNKFFKNPTQAAREEAAQALSDLRKPRRPIGL